jgi:hypothetical protein
MDRTLRVLLVEDSADDAALLVRELRRGGYAPGCGRGHRGRLQPPRREGWDIIISDHAIPSSLVGRFALYEQGLPSSSSPGDRRTRRDDAAGHD